MMSWRALTTVYAEGIRHMISHPDDDSQSTFESELIDIGKIPFTDLRESDSAVLRRAMDHVLEETGRPHRSMTQSSLPHGID